MPPAEIHERADASARHLRHLVVAAAVIAAGVVVVAAVQTLGALPDLGLLGVAAAGMALATAVPLLAQHDPVDDSAHGHVAVLVPVVHLLAWHSVVVVVVTGVAFGWLLRRVVGPRGAPPAACNTDVVASLARVALAAAAAGLVASWPVDGATPVVMALAGALAFLVVDRVLASVMTTATRDRHGNPHPVRRLLAITAAGLALGLLTTLVVAAYPAPAAWLALHIVLGVTIALALSALDMGRAHHAALLRIAAHAHASMDVAAVERAVDDILGPLVRAARVEIRDLPPSHDDVGTPLPLPAGDPAWLVATHHGRVTSGFSERDRRLLASAAPLVATAIENAQRHGDMTTRAATDPLTGVANRRTFEEQLALRLRQSRITDATTALVILDLDDFKAINDEIGHGPGDELLVDVARRLTTALRAEDLVARLGGDEFAVVAGLSSDAEEATLLQRIADGLAGLQASDGRPVRVSFGLALAPRDGRSPRDLSATADRRMYAVKHGEAA